MTRVVYNACFGGFGLSDAGIRRYAEIKGIKLYPEKNERWRFITYWTVPPDQRSGIISDDEFLEAPMDVRKKSNEAHEQCTLYDRDIPRHDPALAQVVEELGDEANDKCAKLAIEVIPDGSPYRIDEYDGNETVIMKDSPWDWIDPNAP